MSVTLILAICIIGCDVLIYFLYEWAFGESERIRKLRSSHRQVRQTVQESRPGSPLLAR